MEQVHELGVDFACQLCGRKFKNEASCRRHERNLALHARAARPIRECYICGKVLARRNSWAMNQHLKTHTREEMEAARRVGSSGDNESSTYSSEPDMDESVQSSPVIKRV